MDSLIKQARLQDGETLQDVAIKEDKIIETAPVIIGDVEEVVKADGRALALGSVEGHLHLDKALIVDCKPNESGTLKGVIKVTAELRPTFTEEGIYDHVKRALKMLTIHGATALRAYAELDPIQDSISFEAIMHLKEEYKGLTDMQVVTFPQGGIFRAPGTEQMMYEVMGMDTGVVGGTPYNGAPAKEHVDLVFEIARKYDEDVDLHQDFADEANDMSIEHLYERTIAEGYQGHVSVGRLTASHALPEAELTPITARMAEADISVMVLPAADLRLGARGGQYNIRRMATPICRLRDGGVDVCIAMDNICSAFTPRGTGDIVQAAMLIIPVEYLDGAGDLKIVLPAVTTNPARAMRLERYGVAVGSEADLVSLDARVVEHAAIDTPRRLYVIKNDRVTVRTDKKVRIVR